MARRKLTEYFLAQGLPQTAAAVLHAPPSLLPILMAEMDLDVDVLQGVAAPGVSRLTDDLRQRAAALVEIAKAEQAGTLNVEPELTPEQQAYEAAKAKAAEAAKTEDDLRKAANRATVKRRKAEKAYKEALAALNQHVDGSPEEASAFAEWEQRATEFTAATDSEKDAKAAYKQAQQDTKSAEAEIAIAGYMATKSGLAEEEFDEMCANLSEDDITKIAEAARTAHLAAADAAAALTPAPEVFLSKKRDYSVYTPGQVTVVIGGEASTVEGRFLDGGVAITRRGYGDFVVMIDPSGEGNYHVVATAGSKSDALTKSKSIPQFTQVPTPDDATVAGNPLVSQAAKYKQEALVAAITHVAAYGPSSAMATDVLDKELSGISSKLTADYADAEVADINDGRRRHRTRLRELTAVQKGNEARAHALASGLSAAEGDAAYDKAYRSAMGSPTLGGGIIPHFEHKIPPDSIGAQQYTKLTHSGIRSFGAETADDYSIIAARNGDLAAWGFSQSSSTTNPHSINLSHMPTLTKQHTSFVQNTLTESERSALTQYTSNSYQAINAAFTGRDANPSASVKATVGHLRTAFEKYAQHTPSLKPTIIMRGTKVPSGWSGTPQEYLQAVFKPGEKVQIGKVTSCSTNAGVAPNWTGHPPYIMVIKTREGLPVRNISMYSSEDEVIAPPGSNLRCVRVDSKGISGVPTVYLVAEDLVAEAQDGIHNPTKSKKIA